MNTFPDVVSDVVPTVTGHPATTLRRFSVRPSRTASSGEAVEI